MKKIRFPLFMQDGVEVRTMEELKEQFYLPRVLDYIANGKLVVWLRDRYEDDLANEVEALDVNDDNAIEAIYTLFDIPYNEETILRMNELVTVHADKLKHLKEYTQEQIYIDHIDSTAFTQDDLYELLDEGQTDIYLCGERFEIPLGKSGIQYHGINKPLVVINSKEEVDWGKRDINIDNVRFEEKYSQIIKTLASILSVKVEEENGDFIRNNTDVRRAFSSDIDESVGISDDFMNYDDQEIWDLTKGNEYACMKNWYFGRATLGYRIAFHVFAYLCGLEEKHTDWEAEWLRCANALARSLKSSAIYEVTNDNKSIADFKIKPGNKYEPILTQCGVLTAFDRLKVKGIDREEVENLFNDHDGSDIEKQEPSNPWSRISSMSDLLNNIRLSGE